MATRRILGTMAVSAIAVIVTCVVIWLARHRGKPASDLSGESTVELVAGAPTIAVEPAASFPVSDANLEASASAHAGQPEPQQNNALSPSDENTASLLGQAPSSAILSRLVAAETHEELGEVAAAIAASGTRDDILVLFTAIETANQEDRDTLARSLQAISSHDIGPDLLDFLIRNIDDPMVAAQARDALARIIAPEDIAFVSQAVPSDSEQAVLRSFLLQTLAQISNPVTVDALAHLCAQSKDPGIFMAVSSALGSIGTPEAVASLVILIEDGAVGDLNDPLAQALMSAANKDSRLLLQDQFLTTTNPVVQYATAFALASMSNQASGVRFSPAPDSPSPDQP